MQAQSPSPVQPTTGADHREDTLWRRWRSLPRLLRLLWTLGRRDMLLVTAFSLVYGLAPLLALITLQRLVDSAVDVVAGKTTLTTALLWLAVLFLVDGLHVVFELWSSLIDDMEDRLKLRVQERLLRKAHRLSLAAFERPAVYDQLHRAQQGLDTRLATILSNLLPMPSYLVQAISLLIYVGSAHLFFPLVMLLGLLPTYGLFTRHFRRTYWLERKHTAPERRLRYLQDLMVERRAAAEIRLFGLGSYLLARYQQLFGQLRDDRLEFARARQRTDIPRIIGKALTAGLVVVGLVVLIVQRRLSIGAFAAYLLATERLGGATFGVIWSAARIDGDLRYIQDLFEYLDLEEESQTENHQPEPEHSVLSPQPSIPTHPSLRERGLRLPRRR